MNINPVLLQKTTDYDNDGQPDNITAYRYDSDGKIIRESESDVESDEVYEYKEYQYNEDGTTSVSTYIGEDRDLFVIYDQKGRILLEEGNGYYGESRYDDNDNLVYNAYSSAGEGGNYAYYTYDDNNTLLRSEEATCGYYACYVDHVAYIYDSQDRLTQTFSYNEDTYYYEISLGGTSLFTYDSNDNLIQKVDYKLDGNSFFWNGDTIEIYNEAGEYETIPVEHGIYGIPTYFYKIPEGDIPTGITTYTYDRNNNRMGESYAIDRNKDGVPERIEALTYDSNGNTLSKSIDSNGDGSLDYLVTRTYDSASRLTSEITDSDGDGTPNEILTRTYDQNGNLTSESNDYDGDGNPERTVTNSYNNNNLIRSTLDYDGDGDSVIDRIDTLTYDSNNNITREVFDYDADGVADRITTRTFNNRSQLTSEIEDQDGDVTPNKTLSRTYVFR